MGGLPCAVQVPRLQRAVRDRRANWQQSIAALEEAKAAGAPVTKTSIMLGCGETPEEVREAMQLLRAAGGRCPSPVTPGRPSSVALSCSLASSHPRFASSLEVG